MNFSLQKFLNVQIEWSIKVFGPGLRTIGIVSHIKKELKEIRENPDSLVEWIDVVLLALDGAWRTGHTSKEIIAQLAEKQAINIQRKWGPNVSQDEPIEHIREFKGCTICGGKLVFICGKYPKEDKREVCPTCLQERLDQIGDISSPGYGAFSDAHKVEHERRINQLEKEKKELFGIADWFYCEVDPENKYQRKRLEKKHKRFREISVTQK